MSTKVRRHWEPLHLMFAGFSGIILLFILAPIVGLYLHAHPMDILDVATDRTAVNSIWLTLWVSMATTLGFAIAAIPFAWILARKSFPMKQLVNGIIDLPIILPHPAAGIALLWVLSANGSLGSVAKTIGIRFVGTSWGIAMAMAFVSLPYLINAARDSFAAVPERLEQAAMGLGISTTRTFFRISLPLAKRGIISGLILMWARGMSEFGAVIVLAYHPMITPVLIWERFSAYGLRYAMPVTVVFVTICLVVFIVLRIQSDRR